MAIEEDVSEWEIQKSSKMYSYGFGYVVINYFLYYGLANIFYFYEVEIGLPILLIGLAFIIFALWNMVNDPLLGYLTERPTRLTKKYGYRAPWIVITAIPMLLIYFFIWIPPVGADTMTIFIWFIITTCLFDTFFSVFNDHTYGGYTNQFPSEYERRRSFAIITLLLAFGVVGMGAVTGVFIVYGDPDSFVRLAITVTIIMAVFTVLLILGIRESDEMKEMYLASYEKAEKKGFYDTMKTALKTKNFRISLAGYTCQVTALNLYVASQIYLYKDVYGLDFSFYLYSQLAGVIGMLIVIPFWANFARKHGFKKTYWVCFIFHGLTLLPLLFVTNIIFIVIFTFFNYIFLSGEVLMLQPVASDTYDEVSSKMNKHVDATLVGVRTFFFRMALIVQAVVFVVVHILTGYNPDPHASQTPLAQFGIQFNGIILPALILAGMGLIFRKYYTLEGAEKEALVKKLKDLGIYR